MPIALYALRPSMRPIASRICQIRSKSAAAAAASKGKAPKTQSVARSAKSPLSFYDLFPSSIPCGTPPRGPFSIDTKALQREFFALQQKAHPDTAAHVRTAEGPSSAFINKAYSTLKDPLTRAQYLLSLNGIDVVDDEMLKVDEQELLMLVLETREEIEAVQNEQGLMSIREENDMRTNRSIGILEEAFAEQDLEKAKMEAVKLRYWRNIEETLHNWEKGKKVMLVH